MRYLYCKLTGYAGIYNGLGLSEIEFDFSKCRNKVTVISGPNGVGKSTIIKALSLMPDANNNFVSSMSASKILKLQDKENIYDIQIIHGLDKNNNRQTSKAFIQKNGEELNSNGNISSYKDIIFTEFNMDANYLELFKISGEDRGIADKKPAERKKIIAARISSLEVYNNIYKTLNKKANIFKSHINTLTSKIQNIGDENGIRNTLAAIGLKEKRLVDDIDKAKEQIIETKTILKMNDPDGSMKAEYDQIQTTIDELTKMVDYYYNNLFTDLKKFDIEPQDIDGKLNQFTLERELYQKDLALDETDKEKILSRIDFLTKAKDDINIKLDKLRSDIGEDVLDTIKEYQVKIKNIEDMFINIGITDLEDISKDEIDHTISVINELILLIDDIETCNLTDLHKWVNNDIRLEIESDRCDINKFNADLTFYRETLAEAIADKNIISILDQRPKTCKDDSCPFISKAIEVKSKYKYSIDTTIDKLETQIENTNETIAHLINSREISENRLHTKQKFQAIMKLINSNKKILRKFSICKRVLNEKGFMKDLEAYSNFNELKSISLYTNISNELIEYKSYSKVLTNLEAQYTIYKNNREQLEEYENDIGKIQDEVEDLYKDIAIIQSNIQKLNTKISLADSNIESMNKINEYNANYISYSTQLKEMQNKKQSLEDKFKSSFDLMQKITDLETIISTNTEQLEPISNDKKVMEQQLTLLESYQNEYGEYKVKYDLVDKLRKYSSPTSGSIQSLFMSIYMDKTLDMVNQLLSMLFGGQYKILQYVINEDEFRIPFIGNGMMVDDISSGSTSQVCMMGMIINLVIANTSSGNYNIVSLDEIDGGLDHLNRYMFVDVLQKISDILQLDQIFIISHSVESALSNVDVILLSDSEDYKDLFNNTNIIYQTGGIIK